MVNGFKFFLLLLIIYQVSGSCISQIPYGYNSSDFFGSPNNVVLSTCDLSSGHSCCTNALDTRIGAYNDEWTSSLLRFFSFYQGECKGAIQGISCVLCSQDQNSYLTVHSSVSQLRVCASYCQDLARSCGTSRVASTTTPVNTQYGDDYISFCNDLFDSVSNFELIISQSNSYCWSDIPECTEDSYYSFYTECNNGIRSLFYAKRPDVVCSGGVPQPSVVTGLPCNLDCKIGEYVSATGCTPCDPGTYSLGSAIREDSWTSWDSLSIPFTTYCTEDHFYEVSTVPNCGWELTGFEINSGHINGSQTSYLETTVTLAGDGTFVFDYKVDCEPIYDGFTIYVDRELVLPQKSTVLDYTLTILNLTAGYHFVQFVYSKDASVNRGVDRATLNLVQFSPVNNANDQCIPCRAGRYQNQSGKSFCLDCPANTYSPIGATECLPCPAGFYSFEGSSNCTVREPCTVDDAYYVYSNCTMNNDGLFQTHYPVWKTPHICDDSGNTIPPYSNTTGPCIDCNPGEYRDLAGICHFCPDGTFSASSSLFCEACSPGTSATKNLYFKYWDSFDNGLSTNCNYFCGTPGWELHGDYIDSGSGHGIYVNSNLRLNATLERPGLITFMLDLNCSQACTLTFSTSTGINSLFSGGVGFGFNFSKELQYFLPQGNTLFQWVFSKSDPHNLGRYDAVRISYIILTEVDNGGAYECSSCAGGTYSDDYGLIDCAACPSGTYSAPGAIECTTCDDGTYSEERSGVCYSCGEGTASTYDHSGCVVSCTLQTDDGLFDLTPMIRNDDQMYGPVYDSNSNAYYLNMCTQSHNNNTCFDYRHNPIETYACQVDRLNYGFDLGSLFGITTLRPVYSGPSVEGVTIHLNNGSNCINTSDGSLFPRQTYIDVVCNPIAGVGFPRSVFEDQTIETSKCVYEFYWESLYGCHVCTEDDYTYVTTKCVSNKRYIQFIWIDNPKACHSGVSLPDPIEIPCGTVDTTYCPPGQYLDISSTVHVCTETDAGFFTIGGGEIYSSWDEIPEGFMNVGFTPTKSGIRSTGGYTYLLYIQEFVTIGSIEISYKVFGVGQNGIFSVYLDDELYYGPIFSTNGVYESLIIENISPGHRFLKIDFQNGVYLQDDNNKREISANNELNGRGVLITKIEVVGIHYAAEYQMPCPAGTFSSAGASECTACSPNFFSDTASDSCSDCGDGFYSYPSSSECLPKIPCTIDDYQQVVSDCVDGSREISYVLLSPVICDVDNIDSDTEEVVSQTSLVNCDEYPCEAGEYRTNDDSTCRTCDVGYYWDDSSNKCSKSDKGYAGLLQSSWYYNGAIESDLPSVFYSFNDETISYWRSRSTYIDSGFQSNIAVDVPLNLGITLLYDGTISFDYVVNGAQENGLFFFINHVQQNVDYHPSVSKRSSFTFHLSAGENLIRWVYHQEKGTEGSVTLQNILVVGVGGATNQIPCPAGSYSSEMGSNSCDLCEIGYYSSEVASTSCTKCGDNQFIDIEGATECELCGENTFANEDRSDCLTSCVFEIGDGKKIDFNVLTESGPFDIGLSNLLWLNICKKESSSLLCIDPAGNSIDTYSCQVNNQGYGIDSGRILNIEIDNATNDITMVYTNGQTTINCPDPIKTEVHFHCDPATDVSLPYSLPHSSSCQIMLQWNISIACPICDDSDYVQRQSDCEDGQTTSASIKKGACYGLSVKDTTTSECTSVWSVSIPIIVAVAIVFVILVIVIIVIVVWNGKMHRDYTALIQKKGSDDYEMSEVPEAATTSRE